MEFCEDFAAIQGLVNNIYKSIGDLTAIRHIGGNERKISKVVEDLMQFLFNKKYVRDGKINQKHEMKIRKIVIFLIFNTDLSNKSIITSNKVAHIIGIIPQFSKCLLTSVILNLGLSQYYGEAICSFPVPVSLELLENCSKCIKKEEPSSMIQLTSIFASSIYHKIYHMRYETISKVDMFIVKLLERFKDILKNYVTRITDQIINWKIDKMYEYMGRTILEILNLLKHCLNTFLIKEYVAPYYHFYHLSKDNTHPLIDSANTLNKSVDVLKECNKQLMSVCEENVVAITIDLFCSWSEFTVDDINLQEAVAYAAYEVLGILNNYEETGELPKMLNAIARKPQTIQDIINTADRVTILEKVVINNEYQNLWYKAFIRSGIFETENTFNIFKSLVHFSDTEDYVFLLNLDPENKNEYNFKEFLLEKLTEVSPENIVKIIGDYFINTGINNIYEKEYFNTEFREVFNKLKCEEDYEIPYKEICLLVLQNPIKFLTNLLEESEKSLDHVVYVLRILKYINVICNIKCNDKEHTVLHEIVLSKLKQSNFEPNAEICIRKVVSELMKENFLSNVIYDQLQELIEESVTHLHLKRATFICHVCKALPKSTLLHDNYIPNIFKLGSLLNQLRWKFFTYSEQKVLLTSEIISLIYHYKAQLQNDIHIDTIHDSKEIIKHKINLFHVFRLNNSENNFVKYVCEEYDINSTHHEQVTHLINLLPRCVPLEWELVAKYLMENKNAVSVIQLFIDVMLILSEMSKKSSTNQESLSYCFQQFCIIMKDIVLSTNEQDLDLEKSFIKNICRLIKHLPDSLHNTVEISLVNLFNLEVLKSLKNDEDFVYSLVSISHLNICKIICSKMT